MAVRLYQLLDWNCRKETIGELQLLCSVIIFGISYISMKYAMIDGSIGPVSFSAGKFVVSTVLSVIYRSWGQKMLNGEASDLSCQPDNGNRLVGRQWSSTAQLWFWGSVSGFATFGATVLLQYGLVTITAGKAAFITGMYVVFVPITEYIIPGFGTQLTWKSWFAAALCLVGLYFISGCADQSQCIGGVLGHEEILVILSMFLWVLSIIVGDVAAKNIDIFSYTVVDFFTCTILTLTLALACETESFNYPFTAFTSNWLVIFIGGAMEAAAYPMCTMGQRYVGPTRASLLMSLDSVVCAVLGYLFLHEILSLMEDIGCVILFAATLVTISRDSDNDAADSKYERLEDNEKDDGEDDGGAGTGEEKEANGCDEKKVYSDERMSLILDHRQQQQNANYVMSEASYHN